MTYENEQEPTPEEMKRAKHSGPIIGVIFILCMLFWLWVLYKMIV